MADLELNVELRTQGKHWSRGLRRDKQVPAVIYGPKVKNLSVSLRENEVVKYDKQQYDNAIFVLKSSDPQVNNLKVLKKAMDIHPVSRRPVHLDLFALDLTKTVRVYIKVAYDGKPIGVKEGGVFNVVKHEVEIECLPTAIPQFISVDVSNLGVGDSVHASEMQIPDGIKLITLPTETLCTVVTVEEEAAAPVAAAPAEGAAAAPAEGAAASPAAGAEASKTEEKKK